MSDGEQRQTNFRCGRRPLVHITIETPGDRISAAPGIPPAATTTGAHPKIQRQVEAARYSHDEGPGHAGFALDGLGTYR